MRRIALAMVVTLTACGGSADPAAEPSPTESTEPTVSPSPTGDDLAGASCEPQQGGDPANFPDFTEVNVEIEDGIERVEFRFEPQEAGQSDPEGSPQYFVSFVEELVTDGEGAPVEVAGGAFVSISFMARG